MLIIIIIQKADGSGASGVFIITDMIIAIPWNGYPVLHDVRRCHALGDDQRHAAMLRRARIPG